MQMHEHGSLEEASLTHAWLRAARVLHDDRDFKAAEDTAAAALANFSRNGKSMPPAPEAVKRELSLILNSCFLQRGDTARAAEGFRGIAGITQAARTSPQLFRSLPSFDLRCQHARL